MLYTRTFSVNWDSALSYGQWINSACFTCYQLPFPHVGQCIGFWVSPLLHSPPKPPTHLLINVPLCPPWRHGGVEVELHWVLIWILDRDGWSPRPGLFTPGAHWIGAPSRRCGKDDSLFCLSGIEPKFLGRLISSLVAILTEMFGLPIYNRNADKDSTKRRFYVGAGVRAQLLYCKKNYSYFAKMCELDCFGVNKHGGILWA